MLKIPKHGQYEGSPASERDLHRFHRIGFSAVCLLLLSGICTNGFGKQAGAVHSQADQAEPAGLEEVVVVASRIPRPLSQVAAQVTIIDEEDIRRSMAEDLDGLTTYQPGLDLEFNGSRFGASSINIRGIGGNRVEIEQDGIPVNDRFSLGAFSDSGRSVAEVDLVKRIELLHGPASVMYGSNAIGGVVAVSTWNPDDLLDLGDGRSFYSLRGGYRTMDESWVTSGIAAWGDGTHGFLLASSWREGHERDNQAGSDVETDPQDWDSQDVMLRYTHDTTAGNRLRFTAAGQDQDINTRIYSQLGYGRRFRRTTSLEGIDSNDSQRLSLDYLFSMGGWEHGVVRVFRTESDVEQLTLEERGLQDPAVELQRLFSFSQDHTGLDFNLFRQFDWGGGIHHLGLGFDWLRTDSSEFRDGYQTDLESGTGSNVILGEIFPIRDFPETTTDELGIFMQDEIELGGSRWTLIPALRWDRYDLDPYPDEIWLEDFPDTEVVSVHEDQWTPRLGVVFNVSEEWSFYGQYSAGFRAPPFEDANIGLEIPLFGYRAIANPDLKSETSDGYEVGFRRIDSQSSLTFAVFHTDYEDFIESRALIGPDPATGDLIFQSRNIDSARIRGFDIRYQQSLAVWSEVFEGWALHAAAYWAEGDNRTLDVPLNSIAPPQAVVGLIWASPDGAWDVGVTGVFTMKKKESDIDFESGDRFATPGWGTIDVTAGWQASAKLEFRAGVFNLGDNTYWRWLDVENLAPDDPLIPILSRPGRSLSFYAKVTF